MIVDYKTDELEPCQCGFKPDHYSMGYGPTPYLIRCPNCDKQTNFAKCKVTGWVGNLISYWNEHVRNLTQEEVQAEIEEFRKEQKENTGPDLYSVYEYYWYSEKGQVLISHA